MNNQFQANPCAVERGLMIERDGMEPMVTDAGMFIMVGQLAFAADADPDVRFEYLRSLMRIIDTAIDCGMDEWARDFLLVLFAETVSPIEDSDKGKLLAVLARLVVLSVGSGRMSYLINGDRVH